MACPQGAIRMKTFENLYHRELPDGFDSIAFKGTECNLLDFTIQVDPDQCNGCSNCVDICDVDGALEMTKNLKPPLDHWTFFESLPEASKNKVDLLVHTVRPH